MRKPTTQRPSSVRMAGLVVLVLTWGTFMTIRPGWDSLPRATAIHHFFETAGVLALLASFLFGSGVMVYGRRKDQLQESQTAREKKQLEAAMQQQAEAALAADRRAHAAEQTAAEARAEAAAARGRHLTPEQRATIARVLSAYPHGRSWIAASSGNGEAIAFGDQLADATRAGGWSVEIGNALMFGSFPGLEVGITGPKGMARIEVDTLDKLPRALVPRIATVLVDALSQAGFKPSSITVYEAPPNAEVGMVGITVGHKP